MVAILVLALSISTELASWVLTLTFQMSAVPAAALFVGLINVGTWVVQLAPLLAEQPIKKVMVVAAATEELVVQVMLGEETDQESQVMPLVLILPLTRPLKGKVVAEGEAVLSAEPGKVITTLPLAGMAFGFVN